MADTRVFITESPEATAEIGRGFGGRLDDKRIFLLYGGLGSGKTTFVQGFAQGLGITARILSPTYIIMRQYPVPGSGLIFYHVDLYRVPDAAAQESLRLQDVFSDAYSIAVVEWGELLGIPKPANRGEISFRTLEEGRHTIEIL